VRPNSGRPEGRVSSRGVQEPVQELTPAGVSAFQPEQDQQWIFLIGTGAGVIVSHSVFEILKGH